MTKMMTAEDAISQINMLAAMKQQHEELRKMIEDLEEQSRRIGQLLTGPGSWLGYPDHSKTPWENVCALEPKVRAYPKDPQVQRAFMIEAAQIVDRDAYVMHMHLLRAWVAYLSQALREKKFGDWLLHDVRSVVTTLITIGQDSRRFAGHMAALTHPTTQNKEQTNA